MKIKVYDVLKAMVYIGGIYGFGTLIGTIINSIRSK